MFVETRSTTTVFLSCVRFVILLVCSVILLSVWTVVKMVSKVKRIRRFVFVKKVFFGTLWSWGVLLVQKNVLSVFLQRRIVLLVKMRIIFCLLAIVTSLVRLVLPKILQSVLRVRETVF